MRILCIDKHETNAGWGAETFLGTALETAGAVTRHVDYEQHRGKLAAGLLGDAALDEIDAVLVQRGTGYVFPPRLLAAFARPRVLLLTELVSRARVLHPLIRQGRFDHVFVRTPACAEALIRRGWVEAESTEVFLSACPDAYIEAGSAEAPESEKDIDVLWVGSIMPRRRRLLDALAAQFDITEASAYGTAMAALVRRARVTLNLHAEDHLDTETRVYEVLGSRGFLVSEPLSKESPFERDRHYVEAATPDAMIRAIRDALDDPERRRRAAASGYAEVRTRHTYTARAARLLDVLSELDARRADRPRAVDRRLLGQVARAERRRAWVATAVGPARRLAARIRRR